MNKVILSGRLTRDPEIKYTPTGKCVASFNLAVDRFKTADGKKEADFVPIVVWGKVAEYCGNYLSKGLKILVEGRLQVRSYEAKDGQKRWATEVIANNIEQLEWRKDGVESGGDEQQVFKQDSKDDDFNSFGKDVEFEEEIPF